MTTKTVRLSVDMPLRAHKKLKGIAHSHGLTMKDLILGVIEPIIYPEKAPNKETRKAMLDARKGRNLVSYNSIDDFLEKMGLE
ncbi:MAG: hypothetical protein H7A40_02750 [Chlamydiales bacterium]|nr:hypothetical protein [Chlamydiales bacterium]